MGLQAERFAPLYRFEIYFFVYFFTAFGPTSAPYTFPAASTATPSAALVPAVVLAGSGFFGSGMRYVIVRSFALPMRMPRFQLPGCDVGLDSESAPHSVSFLSMKMPLRRLNAFVSCRNFPS